MDGKRPFRERRAFLIQDSFGHGLRGFYSVCFCEEGGLPDEAVSKPRMGVASTEEHRLATTAHSLSLHMSQNVFSALSRIFYFSAFDNNSGVT